MRPVAATAARALAPLALMGLIFFLSAQPDLHTDLGTIDTVGRKIIHFLSYAALAWLWAWALRPVLAAPVWTAAAIAFAYAISDEIHQTFVPGRSGRVIDVVIDSAGIALGLYVYRRFSAGRADGSRSAQADATRPEASSS